MTYNQYQIYLLQSYHKIMNIQTSDFHIDKGSANLKIGLRSLSLKKSSLSKYFLCLELYENFDIHALATVSCELGCQILYTALNMRYKNTFFIIYNF